MKGKRVLAAFLLGAGLCFVPALGHGEIRQELLELGYKEEVSLTLGLFLEAKVHYIMNNPTSFLYIHFAYDKYGLRAGMWGLPEDIGTKGKICVNVEDTRGVFAKKTGRVLLAQFKKELENAYPVISRVSTDMNTDIIAVFISRELTPLGYFYQGEYHLWEK